MRIGAAPWRGLTAAVLLTILALRTLCAEAADPQPYKVDMAATSDSDMNATLKATSDLITLRTTAPVGPFGLIGRARGDLERLKTVLESFGYYQSYVGISIDGLPLDDAGLGEELTARDKGNDARVKITFSTGPLYHLRKVEIDGEVPAGAGAALGLASGAPAVASEVLAAGDRLLNALQDRGYAFAKVDPPIAHEDPPNRVLDVSFHVVTGKPVQIGTIRIVGLKRMKESYVLRRLLVHSGELYGGTKIENARKDLLGMAVFSSVTVKLPSAPGKDGRLPITFQVRERLLHAVQLSAAYSSDLGGSMGVSWTHRDISGRADSLALSATVLNLGGGTATDGIGYDVSGKYQLPDFAHRGQTLQVSLEALSQSLIAYDQKAATFGIGLTRKFSGLWTASVGFNVEKERIEQQECNADQNCIPVDDICQPTSEPTPDPCTFQTFHYTLLSLPLSVLLNTTGQDSPLVDARKGARVTMNITPTLSVGRPSTRFVVTQATAAYYFDLEKLGLNKTEGRSVLAVRALAGLAAGASEFSLPPDQRFYAGGSGTIRGYRYQSVGPQFADGNPVGGTAINAGTIEYRQRIGMNFGTAVFVDAGNVSRNLDPLSGHPRVGTGAGVRYYTPIGPLRVDFAVPIAKRPKTPTYEGDDAFEIYIGLGQAF